jgi:acyl carrier protein
MKMEEIRSWIADYLREEGKIELLADRPLFEQIDSFSVVGFLMAVEERFHCFDELTAQTLSGLTMEQMASVLAQHRRA